MLAALWRQTDAKVQFLFPGRRRQIRNGRFQANFAGPELAAARADME